MMDHLQAGDINLDQVNDEYIYDIPQWELSFPSVNLALTSTPKSKTLESDYRQRFLEIHDFYENKNFTSIYTDGSKSNDYVSASAVSSVDTMKVNLPTDTSIFTAEAVALKLAVQYIQSQTLRNTVIYSDSLSCLQALLGRNLEHPIIREIVQILTYLKRVGSQIEFCWIPGHIGIRGNEKADSIAKRVIHLNTYDIKLPFSDLKPRICKYVNSLFQDKWSNCCANKLHEINDSFHPKLQLYSENRKEDIILTRLRIGHSRLTHKHYLLNEDFPECIPCDCRLTIKHILIECIDTADIREQFFNCNDLKTLFNSVAGGTILAYLSEINLISQI